MERTPCPGNKEIIRVSKCVDVYASAKRAVTIPEQNARVVCYIVGLDDVEDSVTIEIANGQFDCVVLFGRRNVDPCRKLNWRSEEPAVPQVTAESTSAGCRRAARGAAGRAGRTR